MFGLAMFVMGGSFVLTMESYHGHSNTPKDVWSAVFLLAALLAIGLSERERRS